MALRQSVLSREYVAVPVSAVVNGAAINPTTDTVNFAFTASRSTPPSTFVAGSWETEGGTYYARCLVGPGGTTTLAVGQWATWVKVTDNPEIPVRFVGYVVIF